jgi:beta-mannosidase
MPHTFTLELNKNWTFSSPDTLDWMPAEVPGTVHTDLMANNIIEDPFYRTNERNQQWIDKKDWIYKTSFEMSPSQLNYQQLELVFEGLDTYAEVYLNETLILEADNFFRSWRVPVSSILQKGSNELRIEFKSPTMTGLLGLEDWSYPLPASNDQSENGEMGDKKVSIFTRKPGYHYGWDWGPRLVTSGIWAPIRLAAWNDQVIRDVYYQQQNITSEKAELEVQVTIESHTAGSVDLALNFGTEIALRQKAELSEGLTTINIPVVIENPQLWWTHDLGEPYLYQSAIQIIQQGQVIQEQTDEIGLRKIELIQESDAAGKSFYFKLNEVPIFAKGANYIPQDIFIPRVSDQQYQSLIQSAKLANMNMLRVWGGGFYEKDIFYELCDQEGILVWQDFMFACSMYPGNADFLDNVQKEAEEQVIRLRNHPSMALWCGNNEIDIAWAQYNPNGGWGWKQRYNEQQKAEIWQAYDTIFHHILAAAVDKYAPQTDYWPSSPQAGPQQHAGNDTPSGDIHYWGVWHGLHPFEDFQQYIGRFMSEYGFQSFPEFSTVKRFTIPADWDIESEVMAAHQRSGIGNLRIKQYMEQYYQLPQNFEDLLYVGQVLQAEGMRMGFEAHRRAMPYCMGSLYWQINDCWPVASWSSMDYYQNWKALHYAAQKAFAPVLVSPYLREDSVFVSLVSDKTNPIPGTLQLELIDFNGQPLWQQKMSTTAQALHALVPFKEKIEAILPEGSRNSSVLKVSFLDETGEILSANSLYFTKTKDLVLPKAMVEYSLTQKPDHWSIELRTDQLARNIYLQFEEVPGRFSENYFDLYPGEVKTVAFYPEQKTKRTTAVLSIKHLRETY